MSENDSTDVTDVNLDEPNVLDGAKKSVKGGNTKRDDELIRTLEQRDKQPFQQITDITIGSEVSYGRLCYKHHAVVVSINKREDVYEIIHLSGDSSDSFMASSSSGDGKASPIRSCKTMDETRAQQSYVYRYDSYATFDEKSPKKVSLDPYVIVERAVALLGIFKAIKKLDYHLQKFNCQHFASYCVTGIPFCRKYRKGLCCFNRGLDVNMPAKATLDAKLEQQFERKLEENSPCRDTDKDKNQSSPLDPSNASTQITYNTTRSKQTK